MFKKLSFHLHKSQSFESKKFNDEFNRDSLIDPAVNSGYIRDTFIEPNVATMQVKPVTNSFVVPDPPQHHTNYNFEQNHSQDNLQLPPLTIDSTTTRTSMMFPSPASVPSPITPGAADNDMEVLIQQGISYHEKGQLEKATQIFRLLAEKDNPIGMFLYGVSLRHGWGCKKNEHLAFQYLQKAAEHAVEDLANITSKVNTSAAKNELVMAIYELGVSFRHGWGCKKDKESAVQFFKIAADLGDPDAQNDLAHCYYHGQGVKKDVYMAAKYYRKADKQGQGIMGNSWIWKEKYDLPAKKKK